MTALLGAVSVHSRLKPPDLIVAHFAWVSSTAADCLGHLLRRPYVVFVHAHEVFESRCQDRYLTDRLRRARLVLVESDRIADFVSTHHGVEPTVMRMGVPESFLSERRPDTSEGRERAVVSVGALRSKKGHDVLIRAVAGIDNVTLAIAGEGPERQSLESLIEHLDLVGRVQLLGHCDRMQVTQLLDSASIFCLASRTAPSGDQDGVPNVLIEAMARSVPTVSTGVSGIPDLLGDGCGTIVPSEDVDELRSAIARLLDDREEARLQASRAFNRVRTDYTTERNWTRLESAMRLALALGT